MSDELSLFNRYFWFEAQRALEESQSVRDVVEHLHVLPDSAVDDFLRRFVPETEHAQYRDAVLDRRG